MDENVKFHEFVDLRRQTRCGRSGFVDKNLKNIETLSTKLRDDERDKSCVIL